MVDNSGMDLDRKRYEEVVADAIAKGDALSYALAEYGYFGIVCYRVWSSLTPDQRYMVGRIGPEGSTKICSRADPGQSPAERLVSEVATKYGPLIASTLISEPTPLTVAKIPDPEPTTSTRSIRRK